MNTLLRFLEYLGGKVPEMSLDELTYWRNEMKAALKYLWQ